MVHRSEIFDDYDRYEMNGVTVDLINRSEYDQASKTNNFINTVTITPDGFAHRRSNTLNGRYNPFQIRKNQAQMEFVIRNLQEGRYCAWSGMRPKDREYFSKFGKIPEGECRANGF
jgi:hypothetical protein